MLEIIYYIVAIPSGAFYDFNGDRTADILLHNNLNGVLWRFRMDAGSVESSDSVAQLDLAWQVAQASVILMVT